MKHIRNRAILILLILALTWFVLMFAAPAMEEKGTITHLDGAANRVDNADRYEDFNPVSRVVYLFGDFNCHQIESRSYHVNGNQMPLCARDVGTFGGVVMGLVLALPVRVSNSSRETLARITFRGRSLPRFLNPTGFFILVLFLGFLPTALDGGIQLITNYESTNPMRLLTGGIMGAVGAFLLGIFMQSKFGPEPGLDG